MATTITDNLLNLVLLLIITHLLFLLVPAAAEIEEEEESVQKAPWRMHTLFSVECQNYFDWQTVGLLHSFRKARQPGPITRLLSCTEEERRSYRGMDLAPTLQVPSMSRHPRTGDWYPAINKPAGIVHWLKHSKDAENVDWVVILDADMIIRGPIIPWELGAEKGKPVAALYGYPAINKPAAVLHWLNHVDTDAEFIIILDADMVLRGPITPWEYGASRGHPVLTPYEYLIGCDNELAKLYTRNPGACDKVGGVIIMHIDDLRKFAILWLHKTEEVRTDKAHYATNFTGDIYSSGWISEMYGYSFGAAELNLKHIIRRDILIYPGYIPEPGVNYKVFHYGLKFGVGNWSFDKADWRNADIVNTCWAKFPEPPDPSALSKADENNLQRDLLSIQCGRSLNKALHLHHKRRKCPNSDTKTNSDQVIVGEIASENTLENEGHDKDSLSAVSKSSSIRIWMIGLWALSVLCFLAVIFIGFSERKRGGLRSKAKRNKRAYAVALDPKGKS